MRQYPNAAEGLRLMFIGQILAIVSVVLLWVPFVGALLSLAAIVAVLAGIYKAGMDDENYRGALAFAAVNLLISLVFSVLQVMQISGLLADVLDVASDILSLLMVYVVCNTTSNLLHSLGNETLSQRGQTIIKIYAVCTVISIVCRVLGIIPIINIAAKLVSVVAALVQLVGGIMFILFLYSSSKVL